MIYNMGDRVVHWTHGIGVVTAIEKMSLAGSTTWYYVVEIADYKIWVPVSEAGKGALRFPLDHTQFRALFDILRAPGQALPEHIYQRKTALHQRMQKRTLEGLCHIIRDLTDLSHQQALNFNDSATLQLAEDYLLDEWVVSLGAERSEAIREMESLLRF